MTTTTTITPKQKWKWSRLRVAVNAYSDHVGMRFLGLVTEGQKLAQAHEDAVGRVFKFTIDDQMTITVSIRKGEAQAVRAYFPPHDMPTRDSIFAHLEDMARCEANGDAQTLQVGRISEGAMTIDGVPRREIEAKDLADQRAIEDVSRKTADVVDKAFVTANAAIGAIGRCVSKLEDIQREMMKRTRINLQIRDSKVDRLPYLIEDLSEECFRCPSSDTMSDLHDHGVDRRETREEWTARKTAELEARFASIVRHTLREWPSHQGQPMVIHTHVDQGVFVLTLKPQAETNDRIVDAEAGDTIDAGGHVFTVSRAGRYLVTERVRRDNKPNEELVSVVLVDEKG